VYPNTHTHTLLFCFLLIVVSPPPRKFGSLYLCLNKDCHLIPPSTPLSPPSPLLAKELKQPDGVQFRPCGLGCHGYSRREAPALTQLRLLFAYASGSGTSYYYHHRGTRHAPLPNGSATFEKCGKTNDRDRLFENDCVRGSPSWCPLFIFKCYRSCRRLLQCLQNKVRWLQHGECASTGANADIYRSNPSDVCYKERWCLRAVIGILIASKRTLPVHCTLLKES